jgi:hypothetical protein
MIARAFPEVIVQNSRAEPDTQDAMRHLPDAEPTT